MFRHPSAPPPAASSPQAGDVPPSPPVLATGKKEFTLNQVGELLEKNLKWSQIIYEQNRRVNRKLMWSAVASWIRTVIILAIIVVPLVLAWLYLPPFWQELNSRYGHLLTLTNPAAGITGGVNADTVKNLLNGINLDSAQLEQIKGLLK